MLLLSLSRSPRAPVLATRSLPAKSTKLSLLTFSEPLCQRIYPLNVAVAEVRGVICHLSAGIKHCLSEAYREHGMRSWTLSIHLCGCHSPRLVSLWHKLRDVVKRAHSQFGQALNIGTQDFVFSYLECLLATVMEKILMTFQLTSVRSKHAYPLGHRRSRTFSLYISMYDTSTLNESLCSLR